jgi:hypothetical protein
LVRAAVEIYGIVKTLGALGASAVLGTLAPALVELVVNLSSWQKWIIGIGIFFIALAAILAIVKPVVQRRVSIKSQPESATLHPTSTDTDSHHKVNAFEGDRAMLKTLLMEARAKGVEVRESEPDWEAADEWATTVSDLIRDAFGDTPVDVFMNDEDDRLPTDRYASQEQGWIDNRLERLDKLRQQIESREGVPFRDGFDPTITTRIPLFPKRKRLARNAHC